MIRKVAGALLLCLAACASDERRANPQYSSLAEPLSFTADRSSEIDLIELIDPEARRLSLPGCEEGAEVREEDRRSDATRRFECAVRAFKTYHLGRDAWAGALADDPEAVSRAATGSVALAMRRNDLQDRIVLRSDELCGDFERRLELSLRIENRTGLTNWLRNNQTRLVGGVGALLLDSDVVWALTNATRITGLPTYVEDTGKIEKQVLRLSVQGFRQNREAIRAGMDLRRAKAPRYGGLRLPAGDGRDGLTPITEYGLERAVADALGYHQACSVAEGLTYASEVLARNVPVPVAVSFPALGIEDGHGAE